MDYSEDESTFSKNPTSPAKEDFTEDSIPRWYNIVATTHKLGFTGLSLSGIYNYKPIVIHINNKIKLDTNIFHYVIHKIENSEFNQQLTKTIIGNNNKIEPIESKFIGYFGRNGKFTNTNGFITRIYQVDAHTKYMVCSIMNNNMAIVSLTNTSIEDDLNYDVLAIGNTSDVIYDTVFINPNTSYVAISSKYPENIGLYKLNKDLPNIINEYFKAQQIGVNGIFTEIESEGEYPKNSYYNCLLYPGKIYKIRLIEGSGGNLYNIEKTYVNELSSDLTSKEPWHYIVPKINTSKLYTYRTSSPVNLNKIEIIEVGSILENCKNGLEISKCLFDNAGTIEINLPKSAEGYYGGTLFVNDSSKLFRHINVEVESGSMYAVLTRLSDTMYIVELDQLEDLEFGTYVGNGYNHLTNGYNYNNIANNKGGIPGWQLHFVMPKTNFLGISFWSDSRDSYELTEKSIKLYKITNGWLYKLIKNQLESQGGNLVTENQLGGILPTLNVSSYGYFSSSATGFITTQGICTEYGITLPENKLITRLKFIANTSGKLRFGLGTIDQRNWAIIEKEFELSCTKGYNDIDISSLSILTSRKNRLFVYNNFYGDNCSIGYCVLDEKISNGYFYCDVVNGELHYLDENNFPNSAHLILQIYVNNDNLLYNLRSESESINYWTEASLKKTGYNTSTNNIIKGDDGNLYKLKIDLSGILSAQKLDYKKITIFGNSIWSHTPLTNWIPSITDSTGTWNYDNNSDFKLEGMAGMDTRGMASTKGSQDFKRLFLKGMQVNFPSIIVQGANIANIERTLPESFGYSNLLTEDVDVIFWRAGENVSTIDNNYRKALRRYIKYFQENCPNAQIILTGRFWKQENCDKITNDVAEEFGLPFLRMYLPESKYQARSSAILTYPVKNEETEKTKWIFGKIEAGGGHPSDLGMYEIANIMLKSLAQPTLNLKRIINITSSVEYEVDALEGIVGSIYTINCNTSPNTISIKKHSSQEDVSYSLFTDQKSIYFEIPDDDIDIIIKK